MITSIIAPENHSEDSKSYVATQEAARLLDVLRCAGLRFAHWKSNSHLMKGLEGNTDLDILVHPQERHVLEHCMNLLGYKKLISQEWSTYPDVEDWLGMDEQTGKFLHLHIHYALVTGIQHVKHLRLPWVDTFFKHVTVDARTGWPIPKPELEAIILFVRIWAKMPVLERVKANPKIPDYVKSELLGLLRQSDYAAIVDLCMELNLKVPLNLGSTLDTILQTSDSSEILKISKGFYAQLKPYYRNSWALSVAKSLYYKLRLISKKRSARFIGPHRFGKTLAEGGKVIALIGSDGSGKSTISNDLVKWLSFKLDTHYLYLGKRPFLKSYNKRILSYSDVVFHRSTWARLIKKLIGNRYYIMLIRRKLSLLRVARDLCYNGSVIICDRFPQRDIYGLNDGPELALKKNKTGAELEMNLFSKTAELEPDLVIKLIVSPEVASERKPGHSKDNIRQKCENIDLISFEKAVVVKFDTQGDYKEVLLHIKREIWKHL